MPSRFPGVDPYLEGSGLWPDFHHEFITAWRAALRRSLPKHYEARINEEIHLIDVTFGDARKILPDVAIERRESLGTPIEQSSWRPSTSAVILPLPMAEEEVRESWIEIFHRPDRSLVAVLGFFSPTNKRGEHRSSYLAKRRSVLRHQVHLVELDLLLGGERITPPLRIPGWRFFRLGGACRTSGHLRSNRLDRAGPAAGTGDSASRRPTRMWSSISKRSLRSRMIRAITQNRSTTTNRPRWRSHRATCNGRPTWHGGRRRSYFTRLAFLPGRLRVVAGFGEGGFGGAARSGIVTSNVGGLPIFEIDTASAVGRDACGGSSMSSEAASADFSRVDRSPSACLVTMP